MNPVGAQTVDSMLRGPVQGTAFSDLTPKSGEKDPSGSSSSGIAEQRAEALKVVSDNKVDPPSTGNSIGKPKEGAKSMDIVEGALSRIAALMQKFAKAQEITK